MTVKKPKKGESKVFKGVVQVYDEEVYIDTQTGQGFDRVLKRIDPLLCKMASKTYIPGYRFEDVKQELTIIAIEGIKNYDNSKNVRMSTFLHVHLKNKIISKVLSKNKQSSDAVFSEHVEREESSYSKLSRIREEIPFSSMRTYSKDDTDNRKFEERVDSKTSIYNLGSDFEFDAAFNSALKTLDQETQDILRKVYFEEKTIAETAQDFGLKPWAVSKKLKSPQVKELFKKFSVENAENAEL